MNNSLYASGIVFLFGLISLAHAQNNWTQRNPYIATTADVNGIAYGNGKYVAVGSEGTIITSANCSTWTKQKSGTTNNLWNVIWGKNIFVAVGDYTILSSPDGTTWTDHSSFDYGNLGPIAFGNNRFVIIDFPWDSILTSPDGINWTSKVMDSTNTGFTSNSDITFGNNKFVMVGKYGDILTSNDGLTWALSFSRPAIDFSCVTWGRGRFWAIGKNGFRDSIFVSSDGSNWTSKDMGLQDHFNYIACGDSQLIAGRKTFSPSYASYDGTIWKAFDVGFGSAIFWCNDKFVALGKNGRVLTSALGTVWDKPKMINDLLKVIWRPNQFLAVGEKGTIVSSDHGTEWSEHRSPTEKTLKGITWGSGRYVAVGDSSTILTSSDGITWTSQTYSEKNINLASVTWGNGKFVAVASSDSGIILISPDGINWKPAASGFRKRFYDVAWGNNQFIIGGDGVLLSSPDGNTWNQRLSNPFNPQITCVRWGGMGFEAFGWYPQSGTLGGISFFKVTLTSLDGSIWKEATSSATDERVIDATWAGANNLITLNRLFYQETGYVAWKNESMSTAVSSGAQSMTYGDSLLVVVGANGTIITQSYAISPINARTGQTPCHRNQPLHIHGNTVEYWISDKSDVAITLYTMHGRLVHTLAKCTQGRGKHSAGFPRGLSPGNYILSLKTDALCFNTRLLVSK